MIPTLGNRALPNSAMLYCQPRATSISSEWGLGNMPSTLLRQPQSVNLRNTFLENTNSKNLKYRKNLRNLLTHEKTLPSTVRAIACLPPEWTATFLTTYWDSADIWRGAETLLLWDKPKRPLVPSPQAWTLPKIIFKKYLLVFKYVLMSTILKALFLPSWVTMNRDFDPPAIQMGLRLPKVSLKIGSLILEP